MGKGPQVSSRPSQASRTSPMGGGDDRKRRKAAAAAAKKKNAQNKEDDEKSRSKAEQKSRNPRHKGEPGAGADEAKLLFKKLDKNGDQVLDHSEIAAGLADI